MNELNIMRKAGYTHFVDPNTHTPSYVLRTSRDYYPRFHVYVEETEKTLEIDLHLDQKKPQYKGTRAHNGEYDGPVVEREIARIAGWVKYLHNALPVRSDALETTLQPEKGIGVDNQPTAEYEPPQKTYTPPKEAPKDSKNIFGGIF